MIVVTPANTLEASRENSQSPRYARRRAPTYVARFLRGSDLAGEVGTGTRLFHVKHPGHDRIIRVGTLHVTNYLQGNLIMVGMHTHHRSPGRKAPGAQLGATQETILHTGPGRGGDAKPDQCGGPIMPFEPVPPAERRTFVNGGWLCLGVSWNVFPVTEVSRETSRVLTLVVCRWLGEPVTSRSLGRIDRDMTQDPKRPTLWISSYQNRWDAP